jgi:Gpi18-like mannosyltransferase
MQARQLKSIQQWSRHWIWTDVISIFIVTRFALLLIGWFTQFIAPNVHYPGQESVARGWDYTTFRLLDIWGRWDTGWYLGIVKYGYVIDGPLHSTQSNIAFFPLYPYLVKLLALLIPGSQTRPRVLLLIGVIVSNLFLVGALLLLHKLIVTTFNDQSLAQRSIQYLLFFPTGFFFSCFYTESAFLFLSVAAIYAATRRSWAAAGLSGGLLALTRPVGVLVIIPLAWLYLESLDWKLVKIRMNILWLLLVPAGLFSFLLVAYKLSGDFLAPLHVQQAWQRKFVMPWQTLISPFGGNASVTFIEQVLVVGFIALALLSLLKLPSASYGLYSLLLIVVPLTSGTLMSTSRYLVVVFPVFILMAIWGGRISMVDRTLKTVFLTLQVLFMTAWCQFYWVA